MAMKIALIGYGRMGKAIEALAQAKGHTLLIYDLGSNLSTLKTAAPDVAIEFTHPEAAAENIRACIQAGVPVVSGTTGWLKEKASVETFCLEQGGSFFYASNFSLGVNIFFRLNEYLASLMSRQSGYQASITEIHHTQKKDAPSGTAITLADAIVKNIPDYTGWALDSTDPNVLSIHSERKDPFPGTHVITYNGKTDEISITHHAHSREGFASGALAVAEWLPGRKGVLTMKDFLSF